MRQNSERLAWTVLLISFTLCVLFTIGVPLTIRWWIDTAYVGLKVRSSAQQGTVQLTCAGDTVPIAINDRMNDVCQGAESMTVFTLSGDQGMFTLHTRDVSSQPVAEIQVDANTQLTISRARAPRFSISSQPYRLTVHLESGRARVNIARDAGRPVVIQIETPHAMVQASEGGLSVQANSSETSVEMYEGAALVIWSDRGEGVELADLQSIVVPPPDGKLLASSPAQDMIVNGDFGSSLEPVWQAYSKDVELPGEPGGKVVIDAESDSLEFTRIGKGHAETGLTQILNRDVQELESLELRLVLRVMEQDVPVCGTQGTECPIMVEIKYKDKQGALQSWRQGFYASLDPNRMNPPYCTICNPRADHLRVEKDVWYVYTSPNLISLFNQAGLPPAHIFSITLYASGHIYQSQVSRVELLAQQ